MKKHRVLVVPGFVADTYSEIESSYVELTARRDNDIDYVWMVPSIRAKHNRFKNPDNARVLTEPLYVAHLRERQIPFVEGSLSKYNPIENLRVFRRIFRATGVNAVYTHFGFERFWATFFGKLFGKTTIWNEHWYSMGTKFVGLKRVFYKCFVDYFIAVSKYVGKTLPAGSKVFTVLNAIEAQPCNEVAEGRQRELRNALGLPLNGTVVLMVAAFRPEKRHSMALSICRTVLESHPAVTFVFLGDGPLRAPFLAEIERLGLSDRIKAPGHVMNIDEYHLAADLCMLTSSTEAFGYCVVEAMKYSRPMVTFACGGPSEIIRDGETGVLVREGDIAGFVGHLCKLIDEPAYRATLGRNANASIVRDFSRPRWTSQMQQVMDQICKDDVEQRHAHAK